MGLLANLLGGNKEKFLYSYQRKQEFRNVTIDSEIELNPQDVDKIMETICLAIDTLPTEDVADMVVSRLMRSYPKGVGFYNLSGRENPFNKIQIRIWGK